MKMLVSCLSFSAMLSMIGLFCVVFVSPFALFPGSDFMSIRGIVILCSVILVVSVSGLFAVYFLLPGSMRNRGLLIEEEMENLLCGYIEDGFLDDALDLARLIGRGLERDELETIIAKCLENGWLYDAKKAARMNKRELTLNEAKVIFHK